RGQFVVDPAGGDQRRDDLVPRPVAAELRRPPVVEQLPPEVVRAGRRVVGERVAPVAAPVDGVRLGFQKPINHLRPLVRGRVGGKPTQRLGVGEFAGQVERGAAEEGGVVGDRGQRGAGGRAPGQRRIDLRGRRRGRGRVGGGQRRRECDGDQQGQACA